jgi:hypothetical protein
MLALMKVGRIANNSSNLDSWCDLAGYAACGGELVAAGGTETSVEQG